MSEQAVFSYNENSLMMGGDCSDAIKVWYLSTDIIKELSKKKNRQRAQRMSLPHEITQNNLIKRKSNVGHYVVYKPLGDVTERTESGIGTSDPSMGV